MNKPRPKIIGPNGEPFYEVSALWSSYSEVRSRNTKGLKAMAITITADKNAFAGSLLPLDEHGQEIERRKKRFEMLLAGMDALYARRGRRSVLWLMFQAGIDFGADQAGEAMVGGFEAVAADLKNASDPAPVGPPPKIAPDTFAAFGPQLHRHLCGRCRSIWQHPAGVTDSHRCPNCGQIEKEFYRGSAAIHFAWVGPGMYLGDISASPIPQPTSVVMLFKRAGLHSEPLADASEPKAANGAQKS